MSNKRWFVVLGHPLPRKKVLRLCAGILLSLSSLVGLVLYLYWDFVMNDAGEKSLKEQHDPSVESLYRWGNNPFEFFMNEHLSETGFGEINSLQLNGFLYIGEKVLGITLYSKRPNLTKVQLKWPDGMACSGFDGTSEWSFGLESFVQEFSLEPEILDPVLSQFLATLLASQWSYKASEKEFGRGKRFWLSWETRIEWQGRECNQLMNRSFGKEVIYHYFDPVEGLEVSREAMLSDGGDRFRHVVLYFSKPMKTGYPLPTGFELWTDGRKLGRIAFTHCEVNRGLMDYLFSCPEKPREEEKYAPLRLSGSASY
ncbi:MAG: hypothetical protein ACON39_05645 [Coraliomargaritaceae bacterium]